MDDREDKIISMEKNQSQWLVEQLRGPLIPWQRIESGDQCKRCITIVVAAIGKRCIHYQIAVRTPSWTSSSNGKFSMEQNMEARGASSGVSFLMPGATRPNQEEKAFMAQEHHCLSCLWIMWGETRKYPTYTTGLSTWKGGLGMLATENALAIFLVTRYS